MKKKQPGAVRIIGGQWRGTRLSVRDLPGLRPSGDRSRETLFNWLQLHIRGTRCVDLFAGSGALGLEAASRGAAEVILVEKSKRAALEIRENLKRLNPDQVELVETDAITWLASRGPQSMDIVFIDPPFGTGLETRSLELLTAGNCVSPGGFAYVETARETTVIDLAPGWEIVKEKAIGEVRMLLLKIV
jgi:16S rRNA (guanine(966)-N(2))-methyltransferase RsmD